MLTRRELYALASQSDTCPRTVQRALLGLPVRPSVAERLQCAAAALGLTLPTLTTTATPAPRAA